MARATARNADVDIPVWWTDYALTWHHNHGAGESLEELGAVLARAVGRPAPWSRPTLWRFFDRGASRITSAEIADALRAVYPDLPPYMVKPGDLVEALELQAVARRAAARRAGQPTPRLRVDRHSGSAITPMQQQVDLAVVLESWLNHPSHSIAEAARNVGVDVAELTSMLEAFGVDPKRFRP